MPDHALLIKQIHARQVFDSRGTPTVEVEVTLHGGATGLAIVPSGASTGQAEALELRDGDPNEYAGKSVYRAVQHVVKTLAPALHGLDATDQEQVDETLLALDGTPNKARLGANAILGVSLAVAHAAAAGLRLPLYRYLGGAAATLLPMPMVNILSGGLHAGGAVDMQDYLAIPVGAPDYPTALHWLSRVRQAAGELLAADGYEAVLIAHEGGYGPRLPDNEAGLRYLTQAIERAALRPGEDVAIALDVAATHFYDQGRYHFAVEDRTMSADEMVERLAGWAQRYPILSIEDGLAEEDWDGWRILTERLGRLQLLGDDLFVTNPARLQKGIDRGVANAVLVKVNQIGTLTETLRTVRLAQAHGYNPVISARSGETEDTTIADLAVATHAGQIKVGSLRGSERLAKYNRLLRIAEELGEEARFPDRKMFNKESVIGNE
ncbi:MAG: phosphopyruvate hydratase [Chloroflexi bacterium]|nr:MAG: phosphopyruvate hydratase [Chloroflexota bacterium]